MVKSRKSKTAIKRTLKRAPKRAMSESKTAFERKLERAMANYKRYKTQRQRIAQVMKPSYYYNEHRNMRQGANTLASMRNDTEYDVAKSLASMRNDPKYDAANTLMNVYQTNPTETYGSLTSSRSGSPNPYSSSSDSSFVHSLRDPYSSSSDSSPY